MNDTPEAAVEMRGITKRFGDTVANAEVDFEVGAGEIHVLLGENGAGKTTLMNILFGHIRQDAGTISIGGETVAIGSPHDAIDRGIGMVHQHFSLVPSFTVAENVMLGVKRVTDVRLSTADIERAVGQRADELGMPIDPAARVDDLPVDLQQRVEIIKAMFRGAKTLIMDEPTSLLGPTQIDNLLAILSSLRDRGHSIILVTHKLAEVMEVADRVTVLRRGERVASLARGEFDERTLARAMTGREREALPVRSDTDRSKQTAALRVRDLVVTAAHGTGRAIDGLGFDVYPGEILGIAGVEGNGQRELVDALLGIRTVDAGKLELVGADVTSASPVERRQTGLSAIPEDRQGLGLILDMSLAENLTIGDIAAGAYRRRGMIKWGDVRSHAAALLEEYDVRPPNPNATAGSLSGGNQQKVVLAREMSREPKVLIADNPTWGLDVGAVDYVHRRLLSLRDAGGAILLLSLDLEELFKLADRVVVIYRGRAMLTGDVDSIDSDSLSMAMAGRGAQT
ncbi:MAG: ABC transporter ATP-binding protein [Acidimicrobiia bacterium]|nr:ABC transporter ATP-binding protein [Acidimicrobiia bacterium]